MEIKNSLKKPYSEKDRLDFIVENNHRNGFEIRETETALEAWGLSDDEKETQAKESERLARIAELKRMLDETDYIVLKIAEGSATKKEYAEKIAQRQAWRAEINDLESEDNTEDKSEELSEETENA